MGAATMMRQAHHGIGGAVEFSSFRRKDFRLSTWSWSLTCDGNKIVFQQYSALARHACNTVKLLERKLSTSFHLIIAPPLTAQQLTQLIIRLRESYISISRPMTGADLGFYKGGCPIHPSRPPPNYFNVCYPNQTIFGALEEIVGARRSYDIYSYVKSLTKFL